MMWRQNHPSTAIPFFTRKIHCIKDERTVRHPKSEAEVYKNTNIQHPTETETELHHSIIPFEYDILKL